MIQVGCPHCHALNRVPPDKLAAGGKCGRCHQALFVGVPVTLNEQGFACHAVQVDIPLLVDFWAEWCGPCQMMAPIFEQAAQQLEPRVRVAKVDTDKEQNLAGQFGIRSIPTLILFRRGKEAARTTGAMGLPQLLQWVQQYT